MLPPAPVQQAEIEQRRWEEEADRYSATNKDILLARAMKVLDDMGGSVSAEVRSAMSAKFPRLWLIRKDQQGESGQFVYSPDAFAKAVRAHTQTLIDRAKWLEDRVRRGSSPDML